MAFGLISLKSLYGVARYFFDKENRSEYTLVRMYVYACVCVCIYVFIFYDIMAENFNGSAQQLLLLRESFFHIPRSGITKLSVLLYGNPTTTPLLLFFLDFLHTISLNAIAK